MASTNKNDQEGRYEIEPETTDKTWSEAEEELTENMVVRNLEPIERRVYYVRGQKGGERVVATIRSRSRRRAIEIATSQGIKVDSKDLAND